MASFYLFRNSGFQSRCMHTMLRGSMTVYGAQLPSTTIQWWYCRARRLYSTARVTDSTKTCGSMFGLASSSWLACLTPSIINAACHGRIGKGKKESVVQASRTRGEEEKRRRCTSVVGIGSTFCHAPVQYTYLYYQLLCNIYTHCCMPVHPPLPSAGTHTHSLTRLHPRPLTPYAFVIALQTRVKHLHCSL